VHVTTPSPWQPFHNRTFAVMWSASVLSNTGTWTQDVGAGWLMTTLSTSPVDVALVQAATTVPIFLFALPAGALADVLDRRRILLGATLALSVLAAVLGLVVLTGRISIARLLALTFALGACSALAGPAWQALVPRIVGKRDLPAAVALNSIGVNVSRAIGPALGGALIVGFGLAWPFFTNAASFLAVIAALLWWRPPAEPPPTLAAERLAGAMRLGVRHVRASAALRATLARACTFFLFASAYWALLPLIARTQLGGGAELYGGLVACVGLGAVSGAFVLPPLRSRLSPTRIVSLGSIGTAITLGVFAVATEHVVAAAASLLAGLSWIAALATLNVSAQMALPDWVRGRGLAIYNTFFFGSMALGSFVWGHIAAWLGIPMALALAALGSIASAVLGSRIRLTGSDEIDFTPSAHWPAPIVSGDVEPDQGPVLVSIEYRVDPSEARGFLAAIRDLETVRRRDGAVAWSVFRDSAAPERWIEQFVEESWLDHLRHHARVTAADRAVQARVRALHQGPADPIVTHYIAPNPRHEDPSIVAT